MHSAIAHPQSYSLSKRITLWTMLIRSLFEVLIFSFSAERIKSGLGQARQKVRCLLRNSVSLKNIDKELQLR